MERRSHLCLASTLIFTLSGCKQLLKSYCTGQNSKYSGRARIRPEKQGLYGFEKGDITGKVSLLMKYLIIKCLEREFFM